MSGAARRGALLGLESAGANLLLRQAVSAIWRMAETRDGRAQQRSESRIATGQERALSYFDGVAETDSEWDE